VAPISWGETYAYESIYDFADNSSEVGSNLTIVGLVNCFSGMFNDIDPNAGVEYSVYVFGLVSQGTQKWPLGAQDAYWTHYNNGTVQIWEDAGSDAVFSPNPPVAGLVPDTFANGILFLTGNVEGMDVTFYLNAGTGAYEGGNFDSGESLAAIWTGGSAFERVSSGGEGCPLRLTGGWNVTPTAYPAGYTAEVEGKIDIDCPTQTQDGSWGRLKSLYH
jgi:hypothetical protein